MRRIVLTLLLASVAAVPLSAQTSAFDQHFHDRTMRVDYYHTGDANSELIAIDRLYEYGTWAGSLVNLVDRLDYGAYYYKVYDEAGGDLIYSRGFDSYFKEYQTSGPAGDGVVQTFHETAIIPSPKAKIVFALEKRRKEGGLEEVFRTVIDPADVNIIRGEHRDREVIVVKSLDNGDPHRKADIAIIGEGYTAAQVGKFKSDLKRFTDIFFAREPCRSHQEHFNVLGVLKPSAESGVDEPRHGSFRKTTVSATFNSMGSERYLLTEGNRALRDVAGHVPYDALYIMVNHDRYGGGGIYNFYCTFTTDNQWSEYLMVHEFGHSFFGLADEYYTSSTAYNDFYPPGYEPSEPNITALLDPENVKWKHLLADDIELPTKWEKEDYDKLGLKWRTERKQLNDRVAELRRGGASEDDVRKAREKYDRRDRETAQEMHNYLAASRYADKVGAFEGAGYATTGMYRPMVDCIMFTKAAEEFCVVCAEAMVRIIEWYAE